MQYFKWMFTIALTAVMTYSNAQTTSFTRADSLRGFLSPERTCYDVTYYHLEVKVDVEQQSLEGSNTVLFDVVESTNRIQLDLFQELDIKSVLDAGGKPLKVEREHNAFFITFPQPLAKGSRHSVKVNYGGKPRVAPRPPWDGGLSWQKDAEGNPWVVVTCQGLGASVWWPNKDTQADEPDSMLISVTVPNGLMDVSNGRLRKVTQVNKKWTRYDWFVANPINNYSVTLNIGKYTHFSDTYAGENGNLTLDYYVMPYDLEKAKEQFKQVKPMLACFEKSFGPYPFYEDGYKLVQSPHPGMEHQSAIAYGNYFKNGYRLRSSSKIGLLFDFIIIHETAHEWFGNSITSKDIADMWVHESFGAYLEAVYVECELGYEAAMEYMYGKRNEVQFDRPILGTYGVNHQGSGDMYPKGALLLNMLRHACDGHEQWGTMLRDMGDTFRHKVVTYEEVTGFMSKALNRDFSKVFEHYFTRIELPVLKVSISVVAGKQQLTYSWQSAIEGFDLPIEVLVGDGKWQKIYPTSTPQTMTIQLSNPESFVAHPNYFVEVEKRVSFRLE